MAKFIVDKATGNYSERLKQAEAFFGVPFNDGKTTLPIQWDISNIIPRLLKTPKV